MEIPTPSHIRLYAEKCSAYMCILFQGADNVVLCSPDEFLFFIFCNIISLRISISLMLNIIRAARKEP